MAGIYIHIPFCASRCIYCDFYSTTSRNRSLFIDCLLREIDDPHPSPFDDDSIKAHNTLIETIYIGGGTPSQLSATDLNRLIKGLEKRFDLSHLKEFTLEMNPEDVTTEYVKALPSPINRVSMGVQSFIDDELKLLRRRHDSHRPAEAINRLRAHGLDNISIDLMYGLPSQTLESFNKSIEHAIALSPKHLSAYNLSIEEGTPLDKMLNQGGIVFNGENITLPNDEECNEMNSLLRSKLKGAGFIQYEISNYALPGYESKHNSSYWNGTPYIGFGPGAHSYDGQMTRWWNEPDLANYLKGDIQRGKETLSKEDLYNEQVMLPLRTRTGIDVDMLRCKFPEFYKSVFASESDKLISEGLLSSIDNNGHLFYRLTGKGLPLADAVIRRLIV